MGLEKMGQGWKKWDRVGKNGTTFLSRNCVGKNGTSFFQLIFPNKLVHQIRQRKILTASRHKNNFVESKLQCLS